MRKMVLLLVLMFILGILTIFGLNRLSSVMHSNNLSRSNSNISNDFIIEESKEEGSVNDNELENQNTSGQIYFKGIEDAYNLLGINEVENIKEKASLYIKDILKLTDIDECEVQSINLEGQKIFFNIKAKENIFTVIKDKETDEVIIQIDTEG